MKNNTLNIDALNDVLDTLMIENFNNLYTIQSKMTGMSVFKMKMADFKKSHTVPDAVGQKRYYPTRYINYVEYAFIPNVKRRAYRDSEYFNKYIDFNDIAQNPQLFPYNYMLFIDGKLIRTTEIHADEHRLGIVIDVNSPRNEDGIAIETYKDYVERNVDVELFVVPNYSTSIIATNRAAMAQINFTIPFERISNSDDITENSLLFMSDNENDNTVLVLAPYEITDTGILVDIDPKILPKNIIFLMIHPEKVSDTFIVTGENPYFQLDTKMPVPIEQIQVLKRVYHRGWYTLDHKVDVEFFYPNIYKVNGLLELDKAHIQVYYSDIDEDQYYNDLELFYKYSKNVLDMYNKGTIPDIIKNYKPCKLVYDIDDCNSMNMPNDILGYKLGKIKYLVDNDSKYLNDYIIANLEKANNYVVNCANIDLTTRVRVNTTGELHQPSFDNFKEPHYVFGFNYHVLDVAKNSIRLFIDGRYIHENKYLFRGTDLASYIYIPCKYIHNKSVLEIERYWDYIYNEEVIPLSSEHKIATTILNPDCRIKNIFLVDADEYYIPSDSYEIYMDDELYPNESNVKVDGKISIKVINEKYHNTKIRIMVMNDCDADIYTDKKQALNQIANTESFSNDRISNYRVFKNGYLLPQQAYEIYTTDRRRREVSVIVKTMNKLGDEVVLDYTPSDYKVKYTQDYISDPKGYVEIPYGSIDKPISLRWFDIYVNGVKLNKTNIQIISPTKFYIKNIKSRKNLVIMERDRDNEIISMGPDNSDSVNDAIMQIPGFKDEIDSTLDDVHDILPDIIGGIIDEIILDTIRFIELCLKYTFIKPDLNQLTDEIIDEYSSILEHGKEFLLNGNPKDEEPPVIIRIDCNDIAAVPKDVGDKTQEEVGGMAERFAVGPLSLSNTELAVDGEMLLNQTSGDCAVCTPDGVISSTRNNRINSAIQKVKSACVRDGIVTGSIALLEPDNVTYPQIIEADANMLDGELEIQTPKTMIYIDLDLLSSEHKLLTTTEELVNVSMTYDDGDSPKTIELPIDEFNNTIHTMVPGSIITSITLKKPARANNVLFLAHALLITV